MEGLLIRVEDVAIVSEDVLLDLLTVKSCLRKSGFGAYWQLMIGILI